MMECAKEASAWAGSLTRRANSAFEAATGRGSSKLPAGKKHGLLNEFYQCRFAAKIRSRGQP